MPLPPVDILAHHAEAIDSDLWDAIQHKIDSITGLGPATFVILIGAIIVAIPAAIMILAVRRRRPGVTRDRTS